MPEPMTLIVVPHTHWDREWYQTFQQFRMRLVKCIDHVLRVLETDPTFTHFMLDGQTVVLSDYLEVRPEKAEALQRLAREGRILVGPWYIQPDEFLVGGEAIVRNLLIGQRMARPYGGAMAIGYVPDCFGHIAQFPQILQGFGIDNAVFWRGVGREITTSEFWWPAPDGTRVRVMYLCGEWGYSNARELPLNPDDLMRRVEHIATPMFAYATSNAILLMNGSDHLEPQDGLPAVIAAANVQLAERGQQLVIGTLPQYVQAIRDASADLPTFSGEWRSAELSHLLPGVLSTRMWIKQRNTAGEELLTRWAEPVATWANLLGAEYPAGLLDVAWRFLLLNQPHDSICGCSIDQVHREMVPRYDQSTQIAEQLITEGLDVIARAIDTRALARASDSLALAGSVPFIVVNPTGGPRDAVADLAAQLAVPPERLAVFDDEGQAVPFIATELSGRELFRQQVSVKDVGALLGLVDDGRVLGYRILGFTFDEPDAAGLVHVYTEVAEQGEPDRALTAAALEKVRETAERSDVTAFEFVIRESSWAHLRVAVRDLPSFGARSYLVRARQASDPVAPASDVIAESLVIENSWLRVTVDGTTGAFTVTDKTTGLSYPGMHRFEDGGDVGDLYNYSPPRQDVLVTTPSAPPLIEELRATPLSATIRVTQTLSLPVRCADDRQSRYADRVECRVVSSITLESQAHAVHVTTTVENRAHDHRLRVIFPAPFAVEAADAEGTFMVNRRPARHTITTAPETWIEDPVDTQPQKRFVSISDGRHGLAVLNRGLTEYEVVPTDGGSAVALTLLRCVEWLSRDDFATRRGHAGPMLHTPEGQMEGTWTFEYAIMPHAGTWHDDDARVQREAHAFNADVRTRPTDLHEGGLPARVSFLTLEPGGLVLSAIKRAEEGDDLIVRWYNPLPEPVTADLRTALPFSAATMARLDEMGTTVLVGEDDAPMRHWRCLTPSGTIVTLRLTPQSDENGVQA